MVTPSWADIILAKIHQVVLEMHTAMPGKVESYDADSQTATVKPLIKWQKFMPGLTLKQVFDLPTLPDVLVCHPKAGSYGVHLPLSAGDLVLLVFCDRDIGPWRSSSATSSIDPKTYEAQPLGGAVALPLMTHDDETWSGDMTSTSTLNVGKSGGSFDFVALDAKVQDALSTLKDAISNATPVAQDGGAALQTGIVSALAAWPPTTKNEDVKVS